MKLAEIAQSINVPSSTVKKWFYGAARPNFEDGRALVALHHQLQKVATATRKGPQRGYNSPRAREKRTGIFRGGGVTMIRTPPHRDREYETPELDEEST
jgi:uncharacterized protein YjcR